MKAIVYKTYGLPAVLHPAEVSKPQPKDNEVLIKVHATSVNFGDVLARNFKALSPRQFNMPFLIWGMAKIAFGLRQPRINILGNEFAGEVEAVGKNVTKFKAGDQVFGYTGEKMGAYAEYLCMPEAGMLAIKPRNLSYEQAAVIPYGALVALFMLRKANLQAGQKVLINGASGSIGSAAVQIAKSWGAEVTGVCSTSKMDYVKSLGAAEVIDYTKEDFTQSGEVYDLIFDVLGRSSVARCKSSLKPNGVHLFVSFKMKQLLQMLSNSRSGGKRVICTLGPGGPEDLDSIRELVEAGMLKAFIDETYPLDQVSKAHKHFEEGLKSGGLAIIVDLLGG